VRVDSGAVEMSSDDEDGQAGTFAESPKAAGGEELKVKAGRWLEAVKDRYEQTQRDLAKERGRVARLSRAIVLLQRRLSKAARVESELRSELQASREMDLAASRRRWLPGESRSQGGAREQRFYG
jgi:hypothetical protein